MIRAGLSNRRGRGTGHDKGDPDGFAEISFFTGRGGMGRDMSVVKVLIVNTIDSSVS